MAKYKNIRIPKRGGGTRLQRVQVLASGKYKFVKNLTRGKKKKSSKSKGGMGKSMGRRRSMTIPLAVVIPSVGGTVAAAKHGWDSGWGIEGALDQVSQAWTGYSFINQTFDIGQTKRALVPTIVGALIHKFVGGPPLNVNKILAANKIPFIRI